MYRDFIVKKYSGTYAETLEAFGLANLVSEILKRNNVPDKVIIEDKDTYYLVSSNKDITEEMLAKLSYFQIIKFIFKNEKNPVPKDVIDYYDLPKQESILKEFKDRREEIKKNALLNVEQKAKTYKFLREERLSEFGKKLDAEFGVFREIARNPYPSFLKAFENIRLNKEFFPSLVTTILNYYSFEKFKVISLTLTEAKPKGQLLYNPNQGKGLNTVKTTNFSMDNIPSTWIQETMKISGSLSMMVCQFVKSGNSSDLKIFVPEFNQIELAKAKAIMFDFKKFLSSATAIQSDILNILSLSENFIHKTPEYNKGKIKNTIRGFHTVYQKKLGGPTKPGTVANIAFVNIPDFIEYSSKQEGREWIEILEQQRIIIQNIKELGDSIQGLNYYRNFLGSLNSAALINFNKFSYWYASYLMQQLTKGNRFIKAFKAETLTKFYTNMEPNLTEIIQNDGFKAVAAAIRNSTIRLQIKSKFQETHKGFEIRYGFAQELINKSKSKSDFVKFISEFLAKYDSETSRNKEKNPNILFRPNVRKEDKDEFYSLLEKHSDSIQVIGALLASYGFALEKYDQTENDKLEKLNAEAEKLGYELIKSEKQIPALEENLEEDQEENIDNN